MGALFLGLGFLSLFYGLMNFVLLVIIISIIDATFGFNFCNSDLTMGIVFVYSLIAGFKMACDNLFER